jgi:hypothetical protein
VWRYAVQRPDDFRSICMVGHAHEKRAGGEWEYDEKDGLPRRKSRRAVTATRRAPSAAVRTGRAHH